jgi:hypothetical protein
MEKYETKTGIEFAGDTCIELNEVGYARHLFDTIDNMAAEHRPNVVIFFETYTEADDLDQIKNGEWFNDLVDHIIVFDEDDHTVSFQHPVEDVVPQPVKLKKIKGESTSDLCGRILKKAGFNTKTAVVSITHHSGLVWFDSTPEKIAKIDADMALGHAKVHLQTMYDVYGPEKTAEIINNYVKEMIVKQVVSS